MFFNKKAISYTGLIFVVFVWGCSPLLTLELYKFYSPTIRVCFSEFILTVAYIILSGKNIRHMSIRYVKIGVPTGFFLALANITQKIGLMYTTPAKYAFLENLSCISVPVLMYILVKKKPSLATLAACFACFASTFILNGMSFSDSAWGKGELLCAIAGILYGFNIAGTSVYAKSLNSALYLAVQAFTCFITAMVFSVVLNSVSVIRDSTIAEPVEKIVFSFNPIHITFVIMVTLIVSALCWIIRTNSMKHIDACIVAVIMPFSAVITSILSVLRGTDTLNMNLIFGTILGLAAIFISSYDDIFIKRRNVNTI